MQVGTYPTTSVSYIFQIPTFQHRSYYVDLQEPEEYVDRSLSGSARLELANWYHSSQSTGRRWHQDPTHVMEVSVSDRFAKPPVSSHWTRIPLSQESCITLKSRYSVCRPNDAYEHALGHAQPQFMYLVACFVWSR